MKIGLLFYVGLLSISINLAIYEDQNWAWCGTIYFLVLLVKFYRQYLTVIVIMSVCLFGYWMIYQHCIKAPLDQGVSVQHKLKVHLDACNLSGKTLNGVGRTESGNYKVQFFVEQLNEEQRKLIETHDGLIEMKGSFKKKLFEAPSNRYDLNFKDAMYAKGIVCSYQASAVTSIIRVRHDFLDIGNLIRTAHLKCVRWFEKLPAGLRDYGESLLLGYIRPNFYEDNMGLQEIGLIHLFSISGFQVQLLCRITTVISRRLHLLKETRLLVLQGILVLFWAFASEARSLIRSILTPVCQNSLILSGYTLNRYDLWGVTTVLCLVCDPGLMGQLGGQLTFALSFALLWMMSFKWWQISIGLNFTILPFLLWYGYTWHPISLLANLLILPIFSYMVVPIVILGIMAKIINISVIYIFSNVLIEALQNFLAWLGQLPGNVTFGQPPALGLAFLMLLTMGVLLFQTKKLLTLLITAYVCNFLWIQLNQCSQIVFFDVGQGDTTYVKLPNGQDMVIDVGGKLAFDKTVAQRDQIARKSIRPVVRYLQATGVRKIDYLVLTHKDIDHIGNLEAFLAQYAVKTIIVPNGMEKIPRLKKLSAVNQINTVQANQKLTTGAQILAPDHVGEGTNADSVALYLQLRQLSVVATGDLDQAGEARIIKQFHLNPVSILKLGHHGSKTSSSATFLNVLRPKESIASAGRDNRFGHPHLEVVERINKVGSELHQTAEQGMIRYRIINGRIIRDFGRN